jgi:arylsulfate sulfotransferase
MLLAPPEVVRAANPDVHLVRWVELQTDRDTTVAVTWTDGLTEQGHAETQAAQVHRVPILGLHAGVAYTLTATVTDLDGRATSSEPVAFDTLPLPPLFPKFEVISHEPSALEPGLTLLDAQSNRADYLLILDEALSVTWYMELINPGDFRVTQRGTLLGIRANRVLEMTLMGATVGTWAGGAPVHHEVHPTADGGALALSNETVHVDEYPRSYASPTRFEEAEIQVSTALRFSADGSVVQTVWPNDVLDTRRIGFSALNLTPGGYEWSHSNAVVEDPSGGFLMSFRHQDAVVKLTDEGELEWILGNHTGWREEHQPYLFTPVAAPFRWFYHQHAPQLIAPDTVLLFDNGNDQHTPYQPDPGLPEISRVVAYRIHTADMSVEQLWEYADPPGGPLFCSVFGDADLQPSTGNILAVFGAVKADFGLTNDERGWGTDAARIIEFVPQSEASPVLDLRVYAEVADVPSGFKTYRAERTPALYAIWEQL